jgi:hypothetical protein
MENKIQELLGGDVYDENDYSIYIGLLCCIHRDYDDGIISG